MCSWELNREIGRRLCEHGQMPSVLGCAYRRGVPVYVPAFTDSDMGLSVSKAVLGRESPPGETGTWRRSSRRALLQSVPRSARLRPAGHFGQAAGHLHRGRGRAAELGPTDRPPGRHPQHAARRELPSPRFQYAVRLCPEPVHWGGLSGCTYTEGVSWGKFLSREQGGRFAEVHCDATIAWPLLVRAWIEGERGAETDNRQIDLLVIQ